MSNIYELISKIERNYQIPFYLEDAEEEYDRKVEELGKELEEKKQKLKSSYESFPNLILAVNKCIFFEIVSGEEKKFSEVYKINEGIFTPKDDIVVIELKLENYNYCKIIEEVIPTLRALVRIYFKSGEEYFDLKDFKCFIDILFYDIDFISSEVKKIVDDATYRENVQYDTEACDVAFNKIHKIYVKKSEANQKND